MARRPRYQRVGVGLDRPAQADFAGLRETAAAATNISRQIDRMGQFLFKEEARKAEQRGKQMVQDLGAQPVLKDLAKKGGPTNIEQRAAFATANRIAAAELETEAQLAIDKILTEAEVNKTPFSQVSQELTDITDGFPAALSDLDPETAGILRQRIDSLQQKAENKYSAFYNNVQIKAAQGRALTGIEVRRKNIMRTAAGQTFNAFGDVDISARDQLVQLEIESLATFMRDLQFDEDDISKMKISAGQDAIMESTYYDFRQLGSLEERTAFIEKQRDALPKLIGEEKARSTLNGLQTEMNKQVTGLKGQATQIEKDIAAQRKIITGGGRVSEEILQSFETKINGLGEYGTEAQQDLAKLRRLGIAMQGFRQMNPVELQDTVNQMNSQGIEGMGGAGLDTTEEIELRDAAVTMLNTMNTELAKDPLSYGIKTGVIDFEPIDFFAEPETFREQINGRIGSALAVSARYGIEPTFLTDEEANTMMKVLEGRDVSEKMTLFTNLYTAFGETHINDVFAQIADKDRDMGHITGLIALGRHQIAAEALAGMQLRQDGFKAPEFTPTNTDQVFNEEVANAAVLQPDAITTGREIAKNIYTKRAQRMALDAFNEDVWRESIQMAFGQQMGMGGIQTVFDQKVMLPGDVAPQQVEDALNNMTPEQLYAASGVRISDKLFKDIFKPAEERKEVFGLGIPGTASDAEFNTDYSIIATGYGTFAIVLGDPGTPASEMVVGTYEDEMGGVEGKRVLELDMLKLLRYR